MRATQASQASFCLDAGGPCSRDECNRARGCPWRLVRPLVLHMVTIDGSRVIICTTFAEKRATTTLGSLSWQFLYDPRGPTASGQKNTRVHALERSHPIEATGSRDYAREDEVPLRAGRRGVGGRRARTPILDPATTRGKTRFRYAREDEVPLRAP